ncbi:MAG: hypothetical protein H0W73_16525 [Bacteroidetes bacterium]|nr:hypothetical protein [Bacteroidota bacterium]
MKNPNRYYTLMIFLSFMIVFNRTGFSQDSISQKNQHTIGFEVQQTPFNSKLSDLESQVGYNLFYRFSVPQNAIWLTTFNGGFAYRKGSGFDYNSAKGGSSSIYGNYEYVRIVLGIAPFKRLGKNKNFCIGAGLNIGRTIYVQGNIIKNDVSGGNTVTTKGTAHEALFENYISLHFEISQALKLNPKNYLIIGLKQYIETPDFIGKKYNSTTGLFLAYNMR